MDTISSSKKPLLFDTVFCLHLQISVYLYERALFDLQFSLNRVDEERQFASASRIHIGRPLHLSRAQGHPYFGEDLTGLLEADVMRLLDHAWPTATASPRPPRCGRAPCCRGSRVHARLACGALRPLRSYSWD